MTKNMKAGVSTNSRLDRMSRRRVLEFAFGLALGTSGGARLVMAQSPPPCPENIGVHNMMVFGERSVFLSHLPMFLGLCPDRAHFGTEHRFQFIVEATFEQPRTQRDVTELYKQDRKQHRDIRMYSLGPQATTSLSPRSLCRLAPASRADLSEPMCTAVIWSGRRTMSFKVSAVSTFGLSALCMRTSSAPTTRGPRTWNTSC